MQVNVIVFGQLTEIIGKTELTLQHIVDTEALVTELTGRYPVLAQTNYMMAVDKKAVTTNTILSNNSTVALLPPFSGG